MTGVEPEHIYRGGGTLNKISLKTLSAKQCRYTSYSVYQSLRRGGESMALATGSAPAVGVRPFKNIVYRYSYYGKGINILITENTHIYSRKKGR